MPPDPLDTLRYFQQLRKISIEFKISSDKEIAQESYFCSCHFPPFGVEVIREPWGRAAIIQCARDLIKQRCYISSYQSYSSIRTLTNYEDCFKTVTLEVESEQNSAFFTNIVTEANIQLRHAFVFRDSSNAGSKSRKGRSFNRSARIFSCFSVSPWKMWPWKSSNHYPEYKVHSESPAYVLSIYLSVLFLSEGLTQPTASKACSPKITCNGRGTIYSTSSPVMTCQNRFFLNKIMYWKCSS